MGNLVLTLDVETEIISETSPSAVIFPSGQNEVRKFMYLSTGRCLTLFVTSGDFSWRVWELRGGEWRKACDVSLEAESVRSRG